MSTETITIIIRDDYPESVINEFLKREEKLNLS